MATALVTQIAYAVQTLFDPAGTAGRLVDLGKLANYGLLTSFTPAYLFTTGVNGTWYDPSDITRYMSSLGPELVTNGDFSNGTTGWAINTNGTATVSSGVLTLTNGSVGFQRIAQGLATTVGKTYRINCTNLSGNSRYSVSSVNDYGQNVLAVQSVSSAVFTATTTTSYIVLSCYTATNGDTATFDNISVRELTAISTATLFQDAAGTQPVTAVEQPVGLMLDKSKGLVLGPELVTNGGFDSASDWVLGSGWSISGGVASANPATGIINQNAYYTRYQTGKTYLITITISSYTSGYLQCYLRGNLGSIATNVFNSARTWTCIATAGSSTTEGIVFGFGGFVGSIDNISVRELPGNHAFNSSGNSANFPVLSARYNLLTKTEQFDDAVWNATSGNVTVSSGKIIPNATSGNHYVSQGVATSGVTHTITVRAKQAGYAWLKLVAFDRYANFDLANGVVGANYSGVSRTISAVGDGSYICTFTFTSTSAASNQGCIIKVGTADNASWDSANYSGNGVDGIQIYYADLRVSNDALNQPAYQRVNTATDYDTAGFKPYLRFNGTNQWLQTNSIDFSATDKMFVSAGVRKLSDAAAAMLLEMGTGSPYISAPESAGVYGVRIGNNVGYNHSTFSAPLTSVISSNMDRAASTNAAAAYDRFNGVVNTTAPTGTPPASGNYGNYPMYIGARAGSSLWFNGRLYQMVVAGKQASAAEITSTETYLNQKTGAY